MIEVVQNKKRKELEGKIGKEKLEKIEKTIIKMYEEQTKQGGK